MSELPLPQPPEVEYRPSPEADQSEAAMLFDWLESMSTRIKSAPNPRPGIQKWFKADIPVKNLYVVDCNGESINAHEFQAELHDQDSADQIWEFRFSDIREGAHQKQISGLIINGRNGYNFLLSSIQNDTHELPLNQYKQSFNELWSYGNDEHHLYEGKTTGALFTLWAAVENFYHGYDIVAGYKPDDEYANEGYERDMADLAESGATIPGVTLNGKLVRTHT